MAWYDFITGRDRDIDEKLNPSQFVIARDQGMEVLSRENVTNYRNAYEQLEVVNRAVNMIVDDSAEIPFDVGEAIKGMDSVLIIVLVRLYTLKKTVLTPFIEECLDLSLHLEQCNY